MREVRKMIKKKGGIIRGRERISIYEEETIAARNTWCIHCEICWFSVASNIDMYTHVHVM